MDFDLAGDTEDDNVSNQNLTLAVSNSTPTSGLRKLGAFIGSTSFLQAD
jgi:hypothetical protein